MTDVIAETAAIGTLALYVHPAATSWRAKRLCRIDRGCSNIRINRRVTRSMSKAVTPVNDTCDVMSALTDNFLDSSGCFDDNGLDCSGWFSSASDPEDLCLGDKGDNRNKPVSGVLTICPENEVYKASTTGDV